MNQAQNENAAQNVNADGVDEVEHMDVVPPHLEMNTYWAYKIKMYHGYP